jgi:S-formylglutathione hydrolase FrmB
MNSVARFACWPSLRSSPALPHSGQPGGPHGGSFDPQEMGVSQATATLHERLDALGIPHLYVDYGPGAHTWPYWRDDLAATLPGIAAFFARAPALPRAA